MHLTSHPPAEADIEELAAIPWTRRLAPLVGMAITLAVALLWGQGAARYETYVATHFLSFVIASVGLNILYGYTGLISLGHGAFFAVGAYVMAWGLLNTGLPFVLLLIVVSVVAILVGLVLVVPTLKVKGHFLAMVTVAYASVIHVVLVNWISVTGGPHGLNISPRRIETWVPTEKTLFYFAALLAVVCIYAMYVLRNSSIGRAWLAIRRSEVSAACLGVPVMRYRVLAFAISAVLATLGGVIYGLNIGFLTPSEYDVMLSINLLIAVVVGGSGRFMGPVLGSLIVVVGPEVFRSLGDHRELLLGLILVAVLSIGRGGVAGLIEGSIRRGRSAVQGIRDRRPNGGEAS